MAETDPMLGNGNGQNIELEHVERVEPSGTDINHARQNSRVLDCVKQSRLKQLKEMIKSSDADVNFRDNWGNTALHYAVEQTDPFPIFKLLLPPRQTLRERYGDDIQYLTTKRGKHYTRTKSDYYIDMATSVNDEGLNVLDLALEEFKYDRRKIVEYIVRETDLDCLLKLLRNNSKGNFSSPFRGLIKKMPDIAKEVMDKCITRNRRNEIIFHYEFLDDTYFLKYWPPEHNDYSDTWEHRMQKDIGACEEYTNNISKMKNNHPLNIMIKCRKDDKDNEIYQQLLDHPLVKGLGMRKWNHIGFKFHIVNLCSYLIYLAVLTACVSTTVPPYVHSQIPVNPCTCRNATACHFVTLCDEATTYKSENTCKNATVTICHDTTSCLNKTTAEAAVTKIECHSLESSRKPKIEYMQYFVIALSIIMILKEVYQLLKMYRCEYLKQKENYMELATYISSILFVVSVSDCENTEFRTNWQWVFGTFSVFMAWINLIAFAKKLDRFGIYVMMFWEIIKTLLLNVFPFVGVLLMAFAMAFTCVHQNQVQFANVGHSLLTTTNLMHTGFDYEEFLSLVECHDLAFVSYIIYCLFQFFMTIAIINLMVGVAVENVQETRRHINDMNTVLQIEYSLEFEAMICCKFKKFKERFILKANETIELQQLKSRRIPVQHITDLTDRDKAKDEQDGFQERMNTLKKQMTGLNSTVSSMENELRTINEVLNLPRKVKTSTDK